jgi:hypothetical protein
MKEENDYFIEGETVQVVEPDDGSGWTKVSNSLGKRGLVPASYVGDRHSDESASSRQGTGRQGWCLGLGA